MNEIVQKLRAPFSPDVVQWRVGSMTKDKSKGMALAYVDARDVMQRLDDLFGAEWECRYVAMPNGTTCCEIGLPVGPNGQMKWRANGAGATGDVQDEKSREMAQKGAYSDAFKRAAVVWGIGQYLYELDSPWVRCNEYKQIEKDELPRLKALLGGAKQQSAYQSRKNGDYERITRGLRACINVQDLAAFWKDEQDVITKLPDGWRDELIAEKDRCKNELTARAA